MPTPQIIKMPSRELRLLVRRLIRRSSGVKVEIRVTTETLGDPRRDRLTFCPDDLGAGSVVYSFGVGEDATWDVAMIDRFGLTVHAFDPTPGSIAWVESQDLPEQFTFSPIGIAAQDGTMSMYAPRSDRTVNYSPIDRGGKASRKERVDLPVKRLATIAAELGHDHIDLLKLDIEGGEYEVLPDILASGVPIGQILVEFHDNYGTTSLRDTRKALAGLHAGGYRIFHIGRGNCEYGLLKKISSRGGNDPAANPNKR